MTRARYRDFQAALDLAAEGGFTADDLAAKLDRKRRWAERILAELVESGELAFKEPDRHGARGRRARVYWRVK